MRVRHAPLLIALLAGLWLLSASAAHAAGLDDEADQWLPRSDGAEWVYAWANSRYSPQPVVERYRLQSRRGTAFRLRWLQEGAGEYDVPTSGTIDFQHTDAGLVNL